MNFDDLEKSLNEGTLDVSLNKVINKLLTLSIYNNTLLRIILSNQGKILNQINEDIDEEQFEKDCITAAIKESEITNAEILLKLSK
jgi:hypothetical protein